MSSKESGKGYRKMHLISPTSARILDSTPYFFTTLSVTTFYLHLRMTGKNVIPLKNSIHFCRHS